jgi:bifunctional non-homologous end joining protein LigD
MPRSSLQEYRARRDFRRTPEPKGAAPRKTFKNHFVVQRHAARREHYDFRLELNGTLKSWAIPKGPSLNPQDKRLAVQVEDHPVEYANFEGVIPKDQYGAGTVLLWDEGQWLSEDHDPQAAYDKGHIHFSLKGTKLKGSWSLVRMHARSQSDKNWLLIKHSDAYAADLDAEDLDAHSVASLRSLDQIARDKDKTWDSVRNKAVTLKRPELHNKLNKAPDKGRKAALPDYIEPQLATLVDTPPVGNQWLHELKYDGYRILTRINHNDVTLFSRNAKDWSSRFPAVHKAIQNLGLTSAWLDGELCFVKADGSTSFQALQNAIRENNESALVYFIFDLLYLNGKDLSRLALKERKQILAKLLQQAGETGPLRFADHLQDENAGPAFYEQACTHHLEGIISKMAECSHHHGRGRDWLKIKCLQRQEFVIGGYTRPRGTRTGIGALLLGVYDKGQFIYTGKVGTGFSEDSLQKLYDTLKPLTIKRPLYDKGPPRDIARTALWVEAKLVVEIEFSNWTRDGYLRQPSFKGLREDKTAREVVREQTQKQSELSSKPVTKRIPSVAGIALSNPNKTLFPQEGITKLALAQYYEYVAELMLPYVIDRPLTLLRCPDNYSECFFQKHNVETFPMDLKRVTVLEKGNAVPYLTIQSVAGLISLVQMGVLEIHTWGSRADRPDRPDQLIFDIDPQSELPWKTVVGGAQTLHALLDQLGLISFPKATGGKGLHVVVPISRRHTWQEVKRFARAVADTLVHFDSTLYTATVSKQARHGKMYIDYVRNSEGATAIAPYSTRARVGAPIAMPLSWDEVDTLKSPNYFTVNNICTRLQNLKHNPWDGYFSIRQSITRAMRNTLGI